MVKINLFIPRLICVVFNGQFAAAHIIYFNIIFNEYYFTTVDVLCNRSLKLKLHINTYVMSNISVNHYLLKNIYNLEARNSISNFLIFGYLINETCLQLCLRVLHEFAIKKFEA